MIAFADVDIFEGCDGRSEKTEETKADKSEMCKCVGEEDWAKVTHDLTSAFFEHPISGVPLEVEAAVDVAEVGAEGGDGAVRGEEGDSHAD